MYQIRVFSRAIRKRSFASGASMGRCLTAQLYRWKKGCTSSWKEKGPIYLYVVGWCEFPLWTRKSRSTTNTKHVTPSSSIHLVLSQLSPHVSLIVLLPTPLRLLSCVRPSGEQAWPPAGPGHRQWRFGELSRPYASGTMRGELERRHVWADVVRVGAAHAGQRGTQWPSCVVVYDVLTAVIGN